MTATLALVALLNLAGCGYVHFGRLDSPATGSHPELTAENTDLKIERKILKEELALARREGDALRAALDSRNHGNDSEVAAKLRDTTRELATLRAEHARLRAERSPSANITSSATANQAALEQIAELKTQLGTAQNRLAQNSRQQAAAEQENARLRQQLDTLRRENLGLADQVQALTAQNEQAVAALSQLNSEMLAQKTARQAAEDRARAAQTQLQLVLAKPQEPAPTVSLSDARQPTVGRTSEADATLQLAVDSDAGSTAVLRTSRERLQQAAEEAAPMRQYLVEENDTLEKIALKFYGRSDQWRKIYAANNLVLRGGRPLKTGMKLAIPE
ncbi:MAG: LysM peptidoglycan-binding domain-containing protein [Opitutaceae bacterium]|nr:LysM peptidoglycan-binding domain-containing protein [Opitutaceae bacterium]